MKKFSLFSLAAGLLLAFSCLFPALAQAKSVWLDNQPAALAEARSSKKMVLMNFTGSDWCPWCIRMDKEIFNTPEFKEYAKDHLVLLEVDFPQQKPQALPTRLQNQRLAQEYGVETFPALVVLDSHGKPLKGFLGAIEGGPKALIAALQKLQG